MPTYMNSFSDEFQKIALSGETVGSAFAKRVFQANPNIDGAASGAAAGAAAAAQKPIYERWAKSHPDKAEGMARGAAKTALEEARNRGASGAAIRQVRRSGALRKAQTLMAKGLRKLAGEMQGFTRIGHKPISIEKMLENEAEVTGLPEDIAPSIQKAAGAMVKMAKHRAAALVGGGAVGALILRQANEDRRLGRMLRKQQAQQQ